jgi:hypothetical protein
VVAPDFRDVHLILRGEPPRNLDRAGRHIQVKWGACPTKVGPLSARFKVIDRFRGLYLDRTHQLSPAIRRGQHQVRKDLQEANLDRGRLVFADIGRHIVPPLQLYLQEANDSVVFKLFADRAHEDRTHWTSGWRGSRQTCREPPIIGRFRDHCIPDCGAACGQFLTWMSFALRMMR